jgi:triosephosphate isomerase
MRNNKYIVGNWKMNKTAVEARQFIVGLAPKIKQSESHILLAVPFTALQSSVEAAKGTSLRIGAQNVSEHSPGPYTGEVSAGMVRDTGATFTLIGHSERRHLFHESSVAINEKLKCAWAAGLQPLLCVGETLTEKQANKTEETIARQLTEALAGITKEQVASLLIAYEPVWAIGTGLVATVDQATEVHRFCRHEMAKLYGKEHAAQQPILYGGSVNGTNAAGLLHHKEIDGVLVGNASLTVDSFSSIVNYQNLQLQKIASAH